MTFDADAHQRRVAIFNDWARLAPQHLIDILLLRNFPASVDASTGSMMMVDRLYKLHGPHLSAQQRAQLRTFCRKRAEPGQEGPRNALRCYLCVLDDDPATLTRLWSQRNGRGYFRWSGLIEAVGDLPLRDPPIISDLLALVATPPGMSVPNPEAMLALGKIGPAAGSLAATVIATAAWGDSPKVLALRDRVLARIRSAAAWPTCARCHRGYVDTIVGSGWSTPKACPACLGLGVVPAAAA